MTKTRCRLTPKNRDERCTDASKRRFLYLMSVVCNLSNFNGGDATVRPATSLRVFFVLRAAILSRVGWGRATHMCEFRSMTLSPAFLRDGTEELHFRRRKCRPLT
jgi:hypothetical protein